MLKANPALSCKDRKSVLQKGHQNRGVLVLYIAEEEGNVRRISHYNIAYTRLTRTPRYF
jgi:hypothetical protein